MSDISLFFAVSLPFVQIANCGDGNETALPELTSALDSFLTKVKQVKLIGIPWDNDMLAAEPWILTKAKIGPVANAHKLAKRWVEPDHEWNAQNTTILMHLRIQNLREQLWLEKSNLIPQEQLKSKFRFDLHLIL